MIAHVSRALASVALAALVAANATAQPQQDVLDWSTVRNPAHSSSYESVKARYEYLVSLRRYEALFVHLRDDLGDSALWPKGEPVYQSLLAAFTDMASRFTSAQLDSRIDQAANRKEADAVIDGFLSDPRGATGLFQLVDETWFRGTSYEVSVEQVEALPADRYMDYMHRVEAAERLLTDFKKANRARALAGIALAAARWRQYVFDGRSQYPWEMALNGSAIGPHSDIQQPPKTQWILLHPELGFEIGTAGTGAADLKAKASVVVQALGHVWYRWRASVDEELGWFGLSATVSLREDIRPGVGFTVHYGKVVNAGLLWHDLDEDGSPFDDTPYFFCGVDLFRFATKHVPPSVLKRLEIDTARIDKIVPEVVR